MNAQTVFYHTYAANGMIDQFNCWMPKTKKNKNKENPQKLLSSFRYCKRLKDKQYMEQFCLSLLFELVEEESRIFRPPDNCS